jgi:CheY-like chemotaxis protein
LQDDDSIMAARPVLVVDDNEPMREALATRLGVEGYTIVEARNGREALDRLREMTPSIILLDFAMPIMNGRAFRKAQKADARWSAIPVILITAHHLTASEVRSIDALAILQKPLSFETLAPLLERASGRESRTEHGPRIVLTSRRRRA